MIEVNIHKKNLVCYIPYIKAVKRVTRKKRIILECCIDGRVVTCYTSGTFDSVEQFETLFHAAIESFYSESESESEEE
jgi:hypothetical protein